MTDDRQLLECVTETADMAISSLEHVKPHADEGALAGEIDGQVRAYRAHYERADQLLRARGCEPKNTGAAPKLFADIVSDVKTAVAARKGSKIAEMVIQGSTMGVTEMTKKLNDYQGGDPDVRALALAHLRLQQDSLGAMKKFLC